MVNIGLYSPSMRHGKSTILNYLKDNYSYKGITLAETLKRMTEVFLGALGYNEEQIKERVYGNLKEQILPEIGKTTREVMVSLGTLWGRNCIAEDVWIKIALKNLDENCYYVSDDIRLFDEYTSFKNKNFKIVRVYNPRVPLVDNIVEGKLEDCNFDYTIINSGSLEDLYYEVDKMLCYFNFKTESINES